MTNFKSPEKEMAFLPLIAVAVLTIIPLYVVLFITKVVEAIKKIFDGKGKDEKEPNEEVEPETIKMIA